MFPKKNKLHTRIETVAKPPSKLTSAETIPRRKREQKWKNQTFAFGGTLALTERKSISNKKNFDNNLVVEIPNN